MDFGSATNALIDIGGSFDRKPPFTYVPPTGTQQLSFIVWQVPPGTTNYIPFTIVDDCPEWRTFVGGGFRAWGQEQGYDVNFFRDGQSPNAGVCPTPNQIEEDIQRIVNVSVAARE